MLNKILGGFATLLGIASLISIWVPDLRFFLFVVWGVFLLILYNLKGLKNLPWPAIFVVALLLFLVSVFAESWGRQNMVRDQRATAPAIAIEDCEKVLRAIGEPIQYCEGNLTNGQVADLIRANTIIFDDTNWTDIQITALLGPKQDRDIWNVDTFLAERSAYVNEYTLDTNDRFSVDWERWWWLFALAAAAPFLISVILMISWRPLEVISFLVPLGVPVGMYLLYSLLYGDEYEIFFLLAVAVEIGALVLATLVSIAFALVRMLPGESPGAFYGKTIVLQLMQAGMSVPGVIIIVLPIINNLIVQNINMTLGQALDVYVMGYFAGKAAVSLWYQLRWQLGI